MPANLKGKTSITLDKDYKAGDVLPYEGTFEANQEDFEGAMRERLERANKASDEKIAAINAQMEELKKKAGGEKGADANEELKSRMDALDGRLKTEEVEKKINAALTAAGLDQIESVFRSQVKVKADATEAEVAAEVARVKELRKQFFVEKGITNPDAKKEPIGAPGSGGSMDANSTTELGTLKAKMLANRPELAGLLRNKDEQTQLSTLKIWDTKKNLEPKQKR